MLLPRDSHQHFQNGSLSNLEQGLDLVTCKVSTNSLHQIVSNRGRSQFSTYSQLFLSLCSADSQQILNIISVFGQPMLSRFST